MDQLYATSTALRAARITRRQLGHWIRTGLIKPTMPPTAGQHSRFSFRDLLALRAVADLRRRGVSLQGVRAVARRLATYRGRDLAGASLVVTERNVHIAIDEHRLMALLRQPGQVSISTIVIPLENLASAVREDMAAVAAGGE